MDARFAPLHVAGGDHLGVDEVLDRSAGEIPDVIAGKDHGLRLRIPHRAAVCTLAAEPASKPHVEAEARAPARSRISYADFPLPSHRHSRGSRPAPNPVYEIDLVAQHRAALSVVCRPRERNLDRAVGP